MTYVWMALGVLWVSVLALVFAMCCASGRADRIEESAQVVTPTRAAPAAPTPARVGRRLAPAPARREIPEIAAAASAGARMLSSR